MRGLRMRTGPKVFLEGVNVQASPFQGESDSTPLRLEPMNFEPPIDILHRTPSVMPRAQFEAPHSGNNVHCIMSPRAGDTVAQSPMAVPVDSVRPEDDSKKVLPFRKRLSSFRQRKQPIEVDRSSRKSLERVRLSGNLFDDDPEEIALSEDEMLERREFIVALMASLLKFGAATHLVENLIVSVAPALHIHSQCNAFPKMMFMTFRSPDRDPAKMQSRVLSLGPSGDLGKLDACDLLASQVAAKLVSFEDAKAELNRILLEEPVYHWVVRLLAFSMVGSMATVLFYGGYWREGALSAVLGFFVGLADMYGEKNDTFSRITEFVCAFFCAFVSRLVHTYVYSDAECYFTSALGPCVFLLPGFSMTTGITEIASGSTMSGSSRIFAAFVCFLQIGFGLVVGSRLAVWEKIDETDWCDHTLSPGMKALLFIPAVTSLGILLKLPPSRHFVAACGAAGVGFSLSAWLETFPTLPPDTLSFLASFAVGVFGCLYARIADRPPISIVVIGILVLLPGGIGVRAVTAFFSDDTVSGVELGTKMFGVSLSNTLGLLVAKMLVFPVKHKSKRFYQPSLI